MYRAAGRDRGDAIGVPDTLSQAEAEALASAAGPAAPCVRGRRRPMTRLRVNTTLTTPARRRRTRTRWTSPGSGGPRAPRDLLRVPIGSDADGQPVELDIKESAQGGMGPHGLVIGRDRVGQVRAAAHARARPGDDSLRPKQLNFVLVDFKGGATFLGLERLPHVSAVITNLADELPLVDRMRDALRGRAGPPPGTAPPAGNYASLRDYARGRARRRRRCRRCLTLFVVLDEFSELLAAKPEFIDLFVTIGRVGRSLGVHLLLASQRLEEGRLRGLETQLSYRIGLRTFSAQESRIVLGAPDAYELPAQPGNGFLKVDTSRHDQVQGGLRLRPGGSQGRQRRVSGGGAAHAAGHRPFGPAYVQPQPAGRGRGRVGRRSAGRGGMRPRPRGPGPQNPCLTWWSRSCRPGRGPAAPRDLAAAAGPAAVAGRAAAAARRYARGLSTASGEAQGMLRAVLGIMDRPFEQRRDPLWADLSGAAGHVAVVGAPRSGKSTVLRTLISSLALLHTPAEVQFYVLDFGGGTLAALGGLPHVGGVASPAPGGDRVRRTVAEISALLDQRERSFAEHGIGSIAAYRQLGRSGQATGSATSSSWWTAG